MNKEINLTVLIAMMGIMGLLASNCNSGYAAEKEQRGMAYSMYSIAPIKEPSNIDDKSMPGKNKDKNVVVLKYAAPQLTPWKYEKIHEIPVVKYAPPQLMNPSDTPKEEVQMPMPKYAPPPVINESEKDINKITETKQVQTPQTEEKLKQTVEESSKAVTEPLKKEEITTVETEPVVEDVEIDIEEEYYDPHGNEIRPELIFIETEE